MGVGGETIAAYVLLTIGGVLVLVALGCLIWLLVKRKWIFSKKNDSNDSYFFVKYNNEEKGASSRAHNGGVATVDHHNRSHLHHSQNDLTTTRYMDTGRGTLPPPGQQLYTVSRAVSAQDVNTKSRQTGGATNMAYVHTTAASPALVKLQPTGYYLANDGAAAGAAAPRPNRRRDRRWSAGSYHTRGRARHQHAFNDTVDGPMSMSRASTVATAFSADSRADSLYVRWSPSMQRRDYVDAAAPAAFVVPHGGGGGGGGDIDNRSAASYAIATNGSTRTGRKHAKALSLPGNRMHLGSL